MIKKVTPQNLIGSNNYPTQYNPVFVCPRCKVSISPHYINSVISEINGEAAFVAIEYCQHCKNIFLTTYPLRAYQTFPSGEIAPSNGVCFETADYISSEPNQYSPQPFDEALSILSPQFVKIYNQALAAESYNLDEIAGIGYRKALEFLIKDFAIHENPNDSEIIKSMQLSQCISKYIADPNIKTLSERSSWLGNDEAHYVRKQEAYDINDMKQFIQATVYFISMILITEKASAIKPVR